jgi:hypothetical protein
MKMNKNIIWDSVDSLHSGDQIRVSNILKSVNSLTYRKGRIKSKMSIGDFVIVDSWNFISDDDSPRWMGRGKNRLDKEIVEITDLVKISNITEIRPKKERNEFTTHYNNAIVQYKRTKHYRIVYKVVMSPCQERHSKFVNKDYPDLKSLFSNIQIYKE